uniref:claudin-19-like isoform X2 n=1 Tax=Styela clava TaxID=7725 RepID=UPI00193A9B06|nr:claudin-19-like isoform X2 [Styela clava]
MGAIHTAAFGLCILAAIGVVFSTIHNEWKKNSQLDSQLNLVNIYTCAGLWVRCTSGVKGQLQCDSYETALLALPAYLSALRGMMIVSCIFTILGIAISGFSLDCNAQIEPTQRIWARRVSGVMVALAGILTLASVSWYAAEVVREFWMDQVNQSSFQYEFGAALYIGWIASGLALISGCLMACCTCGEPEDEADGYRYTYNPPKTQPSRNTEYV